MPPILAVDQVDTIKEILGALESINDEHYVVVYPDSASFRKIYSQHAKEQIEKNEVVVLLPYYETTDRVRTALSQSGIDVRGQEGRGFLVLMDSYATYLGFRQEMDHFFSRLVSHAIVSKKSGICVIADTGAFYLISRMAEIASDRINVRGFCAYHKRDFEKLSEGQKNAIFGSGYRALFVQQTS